LELVDSKGQKVKLTDLPRPVLVTFWSSQCSECRKELPEITQFTVDHPEFKVVLVNVREETVLVEQTLKEWSVTLPSYRDTSGQAFLALYSSMPGSYFLQNGKITHYFPGRVNSTHLEALLTLR
jgi:thiol-disulfide isomerase/thioredoxin